MYRILLLDDEPNILNALRRCLGNIDSRRLNGHALRLDTFTSAEAALQSCEENDFDLLVTDYRMPGMSGVDFLVRAIDSQPTAPRVIISGYADRSAIIAAINQARLTRFVEKPWDDEQLQAAIVEILGGSAATGAQASDPGQRARTLAELEADDPGITHVERDADGGIVIDWDEFDE